MTFKRKLRIILGTHEETDFLSLINYFKEEKQPDFGLVPDGAFIMHGEKGVADVEVTFSGLNSQENKRDKVVYWSGGTVINSVPDFSYVVIKSSMVDSAKRELSDLITKVTAELKSGKSQNVCGLEGEYEANIFVDDFTTFIGKYPEVIIPDKILGDLVLYSKGKSSHASTPSLGRNAVVQVSIVGNLMTQLSDNAFKRGFQFVTDRIGMGFYGKCLTDKNGQPIPFVQSPSMTGTPEIIKMTYGTSVNLGLAKTYYDNDKLVLSINFRAGFNNTNKELLRHTQYSAHEFQGNAAYRSGSGAKYEPYYYPLDDPLLSLVVDSYKDVNGGREPLLFQAPATTYMKLVSNFISFGPVDLYPDLGVSRFHQQDEMMPIEMLKNNLVLYAYTLQRLIQIDKAPLRE